MLTYPVGLARGLNFGMSFHLYPYIVMLAAKVLVSLHICARMHDPLLLKNTISTKKFCVLAHLNIIFKELTPKNNIKFVVLCKR